MKRIRKKTVRFRKKINRLRENNVTLKKINKLRKNTVTLRNMMMKVSGSRL